MCLINVGDKKSLASETQICEEAPNLKKISKIDCGTPLFVCETRAISGAEETVVS